MCKLTENCFFLTSSKKFSDNLVCFYVYLYNINGYLYMVYNKKIGISKNNKLWGKMIISGITYIHEH